MDADGTNSRGRRRSARGLTLALAGLLSVCGLPACGGSTPGEPDADSGPRWISLARGWTPGAAEDAVAGWGEGSALRARDDGEGGVWLETDIPRDAWRRLQVGGNAYYAPREDTGGFRHHAGEDVRLSADGAPLTLVTENDLTRGDEIVEEGVFAVSARSTLLRLPDGEEPPLVATLATYLERGRTVDGTWRPALGGLVGDGLSIWPGERSDIRVDVPPESALRFRAVAHGIGTAGRAIFRVRLDGKVLVEAPLDYQDREASLRGEVSATHLVSPLPRAGASGVTLTFEVEGDPGVTAILDPVVGPLEVGDYGDRPWEDAAPDIVVFLADTFRADNLAAWGGAPEVAPNTNALADASVRFLETRATSVWTLPTHASMFSGLFPLQHGAITSETKLSPDLLTIAEHLAAHGYRTGAITEGAFVSRTYGLDQGFAWFEERTATERPYPLTLAGALDFLDADDGRPVFLFVHTYRVHAPYRIGAEEDAEPERDLMRRIGVRMREIEAAGGPAGISPEIVKEFRDEYHGLYLSGVTAFDELFGAWMGELDDRGLASGYFVFTSDHGEEFYEHGNRHHGFAPHEEKIRVPLLVRGPGLEPRDVSLGTSGVDLAPTVAELARVPALDGWMGRSVLGLDVDRPLFAYNLKRGDREYLSAFVGDQKIYAEDGDALLRGELEHAFDLERDPGETANVVGHEDWPEELAERVQGLWRLVATPTVTSEGVELDAAELENLRDLGYVE